MGALQDMHPFYRNILIGGAAGFIAGVLVAGFYYVLGQFTGGVISTIVTTMLISIVIVGPVYRRFRNRGIAWLTFAMMLVGVTFLIVISAISGGPQKDVMDNVAMVSFFPVLTLVSSLVYAQLHGLYSRHAGGDSKAASH